MGRLEKQIIIGALALVGVLLTVVVLKGLQPRDDQSVDLGSPGEWERNTPRLDAFGGAGDTSLKLDAEFRPASDRGGDTDLPEPAVFQPETETETQPGPLVDEHIPVEPPTARDPDQPREYVVKSGEILGLIAQRELGSVRHLPAILDLNPHLHPSGDNISEGDVLLLPSRASLEPEREAPPAQRPPELVGVRTHKVASGDSLWAISMKYFGSGGHADKIIAANPDLLKDGEDTTLRLGWTLVIPE